jgi:TonB family protein
MRSADKVEERRRHPRRHITGGQLLTASLALRSVNGDLLHRSGVVLDLSEGGMGVRPFLPLARGAVGGVHLDLSGAGRAFTGKGLVAWAASGGRAGICFLEVPQNAREQLRYWLNEGVCVALEPEKVDVEKMVSGTRRDGGDDELDFQAALDLIAERAQAITGASGAALALGDRTGMVCQASVGEAPDVGVQLRPEAGLSGYCLRTGEVIHCSDTESDPRVNAAAARQLKLGSAIIVPVFALGRLSGLLEVFSPRAHAFDEKHVARLERFAELLASAVEENQKEQKFAASSVAASLSDPPVPPEEPVSRPESESPAPPLSEPAIWVETDTLKPVPAAPPSPYFVFDRAPKPVGPAPNADLRPSGIKEDAPRTLNAQGGGKVWQTCSACGHLNPPWAVQCEGCKHSLDSLPANQAPDAGAPAPGASAVVEPKLAEAAPAAPDFRRVRTLVLGGIILLVLCVLAFFAGRYLGRARLTAKPAETPSSSALPPEASATSQTTLAPAATASIPPELAANSDASASSRLDGAELLKPVRLTMLPEKRGEATLPGPEQTQQKKPEITTALMAVTMPQGTSESAPITVGKLVHRVDPAYPAAAREKKLSGVAVLSAVVSKMGTMKEVNLISGPEALGAEAIKAIRQWRYEPYRVAGQPVDVKTTITVTFPPGRE